MGRQRKRAKKQTEPLFRMVVASSPGTEISIEPELGQIKAALLYGDEVTLLSPLTTMLLGAEHWTDFSMLQQLQLVRKVAPYLDADAAVFAGGGADQLESALRGGKSNRLVQARLKKMFAPAQESLVEAINGVAEKAGMQQLEDARSKGLLRIESVDPGTSADLIAWVVISARLVEEGKPNDATHTDEMVNTFLGKLSEHLSSGREYLIFDEQVADLARAAIAVGVFKPAKGPAGRSAQAMTASGFMARLPTFPDASVDEILDIRDELANPLTQFRSAMVTLSKGFTSPAWDEGFEDEVHDAWVESVHPAVEGIDEAVSENKSLLTLASDTTGALKAAIPGLAILGAGAGSHDPAMTFAGGGAATVGPLLQGLRERKESQREMRMQPFYFLYGLKRKLPGLTPDNEYG